MAKAGEAAIKLREPTEKEKDEILDAVLNGDVLTLQDLFYNGINVTAVYYKDQLTPLHFASQIGHSSTVEILIKCGANVNAVEEDQWTPLHIASQIGHSSTVEILINCGANVNAVNKNQATPLHIALQNGHSSTVEILIKCGANVNAVAINQWTPLHIASQNGHSSIVEILIKCGANVNAVNKNQWTPLHIASQNGHSSIVEILIKCGANVNAVEEDQWTPLHIASQIGHSSTVEILINCGANVNAVNKDQWTPLHIASENGHSLTVEILIKCGANVNAVAEDHWTPLHIASENGHSSTVKILIKCGADINAVDKETQQKISELLMEAEKEQSNFDEEAESTDAQQGIMLAKLEQAKANNETLKVSYTTVLFSGSSGVGKTTLLNKLNKENLNRHHHSTGVAQSKHTVCIETTAVVESTEGLQWTNLDYDSMINHLNKYLQNLRFPSVSLAAISSLPEENTQSNTKPRFPNLFQLFKRSAADSSPKDNTLNSTSQKSKIKSNKTDVTDIPKPDLVAYDIAKADSSKTPSLGNVWDIINFLDTGGQPEFVNILPAVSSSIALTFIVFDLSKSLDSLVTVQHSVNGCPSFEPYDLDCTNLEFIKHLLVSSENFNKNYTPLRLKTIKRPNSQNDSKTCYVGTHAHPVSKETIKEVDDQLTSIANELELHQTSFCASPKEQLNRLFPVDLFPVDKEEEKEFEGIIEDIRDNIQKQVKRRDYFEVPILWFIFLLKLQKLCNVKNISYLTYQEAVDIWMEENASKNKLKANFAQRLFKSRHESVSRFKSDVHNILLFFHFMGILFYYHEVKGLCDYVFIDRQWLFEKLTELVEFKFTKGFNKKDINAVDVEQFTKEGRLNINIIKNLKVNLQGIEPLYFIHLLDHLNIVVPIDSKLKDYFMPCVLPSFPLTSDQKLTELDNFFGTIQYVPLLVRFKNGPINHGFFCHLVVELFRKLPKGWDSPFLSTSRMQHAYNNLITFPTSSGHAISVFYKIGHLEIQVRHIQSHPTVIHYNVQCELDKTLRRVSGHLQLNKVQYCYGFYCNCKGIQHFAKLKKLTSLTEYIRCDYGSVELTKDHTVWLKEFKDHKTVCAIQQIPPTGKVPKMFDLTSIVIPKIMNKWEYVAEALQYDLVTIEAIREKGQGDPNICCREFFKDWLMTNNGAESGPKVWSTLFDALKKVDQISADITEDIIAQVSQLS